jgi:hypothetical protein
MKPSNFHAQIEHEKRFIIMGPGLKIIKLRMETRKLVTISANQMLEI